MEGTILDVILLNCSLSETEVLSGNIETGSVSDTIVDSNGNTLIDDSENIFMDFRIGHEFSGTILDVINMSADLSVTENIQGTLSLEKNVAADISLPFSIGGQPYTGEYEVTPNLEIQVLNTNGKSMRNNVTINPIPSNYGLITWNGYTLTVS